MIYNSITVSITSSDVNDTKFKNIDSTKYESINDLFSMVQSVFGKYNVSVIAMCKCSNLVECFKYDTVSKNIEQVPYFDTDVIKTFKPIINVVIPKIVYHKSNPFYREQILSEGLIPKVGDSYTAHYDFYENLIPVVFLSTTDTYDTTYDDDIYAIETKNLDINSFVDDCDVKNGIAYLKKISPDNIKLIYEGTVDALDD